jgi:cellulose synthase/poly-beta-1,6-N-acetylglucosamine synthase-like glycosyltransferase
MTSGCSQLSQRLDQAFAASSPRFAPPPTPLASLLIHGFVLALWLVLFTRAFGGGGVLAWAIGLAYVGYDTALQIFVLWQTLPLLRRPAPPIATSAPVTLGVIVAAHNEAGILPKTLAALFAQTDLPDAILIADDGSFDSTGAVLAGYGLQIPPVGGLSGRSAITPSLRWLRLPHRGKARALNEAIGAIETDIVLTVDADTMLHEGAIAAMQQALPPIRTWWRRPAFSRRCVAAT